MDDLLNRTRYNNLIRPAASSAQLVSIQLQLSLAQLISVVGAGGPVQAAGPERGAGGSSGLAQASEHSQVTHRLLYHVRVSRRPLKPGARLPLCWDSLVLECGLCLVLPPRWVSPACRVPAGPTVQDTG